jgi:glycosyltransferase involved in cell wall biosynthesis
MRPRDVASAFGRTLRTVAQTLGWTTLVPMLRRRARRRAPDQIPHGVTVVTVNWNSLGHLEVLIDAVRRRSPPDTRILVVDNGSREPLPSLPGVRVVRLPLNMGHDFALDVGVLLCQTEYVVALDVDAFPLHAAWLRDLLAPLDQGCQVSGARLNRQYVHPCCWAMRTARFIGQSHSFRSHYRPRAPGRDASGAVGEEISAREAGALRFFEITSQRGPGDVGTVFGDLVYHNFYATRFRASREPTLDGTVEPGDPERAWQEALRRYGLERET